jgi:hypothetical protein
MFYSKTVKEDKDDFIVSDPAPEFKEATAPKDDLDMKSSPVACDAMIRTMQTLGTMAGWEFHVVDVQGAFLNGEFEDGEQFYMAVPDGFK